MASPRRIIHLDMDAFYASVEQRDDPALRGKPVAVGGGPAKARGVVAAASYEARTFGVRSAMPMARACGCARTSLSSARTWPATGPSRGRSSRSLGDDAAGRAAVARRGLPRRHRERLGEPSAWTVARRMKARIRDETALTASAGVAPNKFLAKIASGWKKPDGLRSSRRRGSSAFLRAPGRRAVGVGPVTAGKLRELGLAASSTCGRPNFRRSRRSGSRAASLSAGPGARRPPRSRPAEAKSFGPEETYVRRPADARRCRRSARPPRPGTRRGWRGSGRLARTVALEGALGDFTTVTRSHTGEAPSRNADEIRERALALLGRTEAAAPAGAAARRRAAHGLMTPEEMVAAAPPDPQLPLLAED